MRRTWSVLCGTGLVVFLLAAGSPAHAAAQGTTSWNVCGGNHFNTCAAVNLAVSTTGAGAGFSHRVVMEVWNLSNLGDWAATVFTKIGFFNTGASFSNSGNLSMTGPWRGEPDPGERPDEWQLADPNNAGGVSLEMVTSANGNNSAVRNSIANACDQSELPGGNNDLWMNPCASSFGDLGNHAGATNGGWVVIEFDVAMTGTWSLTATDMLIQAQNGPGGESAQCITGGDNLNCHVVPEPVTLLLMGTGLLGVGAVHVRRRRQDPEGEEQSAL